MQFRLDMDDRSSLLQEVQDRLVRHFPDFPPRYILLDPVSQLVMSLLGGRTRSPVSRQAHFNLMQRFRDWSEVRDADVQEIEVLIAAVTFASDKAVRIKAILTHLSDRTGRPSLASLEPLSVQAAHERLERINGIGPKIAAAVLNTSTFRRRSLVIDSHHLRILVRLGVLPPGSDFRKAYRLTMPLMPDDWCAETIDVHHMLFKKLGQEVCRYGRARCGACPLSDLCRYGRRYGPGNLSPAPPNRRPDPASPPAP